MKLTTEQEAFRGLFAQKLRKKVDEVKVELEAGAENAIAEGFVLALIEFKEKLSEDSKTHHQTKGETSWSVEREKITTDFALKLDTIFAPVQGIKPKEASAYWSGAAVKRAAEFGEDFANTIPGFVVNQVSASLHEVFTKKAYTADGLIDTAANVGIWDAMSRLYAEGTTEDAHVFLVDGETSYQSIFWNTELNTLRKRQYSGEVKEIVLHTLTNEALPLYQSLLQQKRNLSLEDIHLLQSLDKQIDQLLKNDANWNEMNLDDSMAFKLKTSGLTDDHKVVNYHKIKAAATQFNAFTQKQKSLGEKNSVTSSLEALQQQLDEIKELMKADQNPAIRMTQLKVLKQQINILPTNTSQRDEVNTLEMKQTVTSMIAEVASTLDQNNSKLSY